MATMKPMTLSQLMQHAQKLQGAISPATHLDMLLESHEFKDLSIDASEFFYYVLNDPTFFDADKMPTRWSMRTTSAAMESLKIILLAETIKKDLVAEIGEEDYAGIVKVVDDKRKWYMNEAKKEQRKAANTKKTSTVVIDPVPDPSDPTSTSEPAATPPPTNDITKGHIAQAMWILDRFMESEKDEFKVILLELLQKELVMAMSNIQ